jgi:predicted transcriptional regulator
MKREDAEKMVTITVRVPEALAHRLKLHAVRNKQTVQKLMAKAIDLLLKAEREQRGGDK